MVFLTQVIATSILKETELNWVEMLDVGPAHSTRKYICSKVQPIWLGC